MREFLSKAPGALWVAVIVGVMAFSQWLTTYFDAVPWVPPVAGLLATVIVPVLKVLFEPQSTAFRIANENRSWFRRWLI